MKKFLIGLIVVLLLLIGGVAGYIALFDINSYKGMIEKTAGEAIGRPVFIRGSMELTKSFVPVLVINDIEIRNDKEGFSSPNLAVIKQARVDLDLMSLLHKMLNIKDVRVQDVKVFLDVTEKGENNWQFAAKSTTKASSKPPVKQKPTLSKKLTNDMQISINSIRVSDMVVYYNDSEQKKNWQVNIASADLTQLVNLNASLKWNNEPFTVKGSMKNLQGLLQGKSRSFGFSFDVNAYQAKTTLSANIRDIQNLDNLTINIKSEGKNLRNSAAFISSSKDIPAVPFSIQGAVKILKTQLIADGSFSLLNGGVAGNFNAEVKGTKNKNLSGRLSLSISDENFLRPYGIKPFSLETKISSAKPGELDLSNLTMTANESDIDGQLKIVLNGKRPFISGELNSRYFSLNDILAETPAQTTASASNTNAEKRQLFSSSPLSADFLTAVDLNILALIENLNVNGVLTTYPRLMLNAQLNDGTLNVSLLEGTQVLGGPLVGLVAIQKQDSGVLASVQLVGEGLKLDDFSVFKNHLQGGTIATNVNLTTAGGSAQQLAGNLNGTFLMTVQDSEIFSQWLSKLPVNIFQIGKKALPYQQSYSNALSLKCAAFNVRIENGLIRLNRKVAMETNLLNMVFDGTVNLKNEKLDVQLVPMAPKGKTTEAVNLASQFVTIGGTLLDPMPRPAVVKSAQTIATAIMTGGVSIPATQVVKKVIEDTNPCQTAMNGVKMQTVDEYLGHAPVSVKQEPAPVVQEPVQPKPTKAQQFGEQFFNSLSDALTQGIQSATGS